MRWTSRLRRHGGFLAIQEKRVKNFKSLAEVDRKISGNKSRIQAVHLLTQAARKWLNGHPLRVLLSGWTDQWLR